MASSEYSLDVKAFSGCVPLLIFEPVKENSYRCINLV